MNFKDFYTGRIICVSVRVHARIYTVKVTDSGSQLNLHRTLRCICFPTLESCENLLSLNYSYYRNSALESPGGITEFSTGKTSIDS